jgi:hypothetical protein
MDEETNRLDRLYNLLPAVYRIRDVDEGWPLKAFLRVIAEQANALEDDILQLYDNWFIETAQDWVVPYIGDLVGYRPGRTTGEEEGGAAVPRILVPRREVAKTIGYRRRKGTPALLEDLARNVAGWPGHAVEFRRFLAWFQNLNHPRPGAGGTVDVHQVASLERLGTPADELAHLADVRAIGRHKAGAYYNLPGIGLFVWRLKSYPVTRVLAQARDDVQDAYTFSILGNDMQLFASPPSAAGGTDDCPDLHGPMPITRHAFQRCKECYYGEGKSLAIWAEGDDGAMLVPAEAIIPADLTDWQYRPRRGMVAVDPVLGRISFAVGAAPKRVRVTYHYGFSMDMGGGQYDRPLIQPETYRFYRMTEAIPRGIAEVRAARRARGPRAAKASDVRLAKATADQEHRKISQVIEEWRNERDAWHDAEPSDEAAHAAWLALEPPRNVIVELADNGIYTEQFDIQLEPRESLQIRAANGMRPTLALLNREPALPDALEVSMGPGSHFTLDGLLITGRPVHVTTRANDTEDDKSLASCLPNLTIRHCTLVPGWGLDEDCKPDYPAEPSLELMLDIPARVAIQHSIVGSIQVHLDPVQTDPMPMEITDSIIDATSDDAEALGSPGYEEAHVVLTIRRSTVFGMVDVHAIEMAENSIFTNCLNVARRQLGCMRFCYVPHDCRTPQRYNCQPDLAAQAAAEELAADYEFAGKPEPTQDEIDLARSRAYGWVRPQFCLKRYGVAEYGRLADTCPQEISQGADDESEMGAFHDLFQPQRAANLAAALEAYTPAEMEAGIIFAS